MFPPFFIPSCESTAFRGDRSFERIVRDIVKALGMNIRSLITHCVVLCGIGMFSLPSANAAEPQTTKVITIVALGDSLTDGFGLSRKEAWPALIGEKMRAANYRFEVTNAGVSGDTTAGGLHRLPPLLKKKKVDVLIVALGINDAFRGISIEEIRSNFQTIIDRARAEHPAVSIVIAGIRFPFASGNGYVQEFGEMYATLAEKNHATLIPYLLEGVGGNPDLNLPDLIHPNAAGQRILAENVWRVLEPILQKISG